MNKRLKTSLIAGASVVTLGAGLLATTSIASAATGASGTSIIDEIASKFNLNRADVAAVFAQDRASHQAQMEADQATKLAAAVKAGTITQAQSDYITNAQKNIDALRDKTDPGTQPSSSEQTAVQQAVQALQTWAQQNNIPANVIDPMGHGGPGGSGPDDGMPPIGTPSSSSSSSTSSN